MLRLDHNRALSQVAAKIGKPVTAIEKLCVWGNHSPTMYADYRFATADGKPVKPALPRDYTAPSDLQDRLVLPLLNEAVAALHDGVVADPDLLDAGVVFGTGFAPFRGGPIQYIRQTGVEVLLDTLRGLQARHGDRFTPRPGWDSPLLRE